MQSAHLTSKYREESDRVTRCHHTFLLLRWNFWQLLFKVGQTSKEREEFKMVQYADDSTLFVPDLACAQHVVHLFDQYEACLCLKLNYSKTEAMWIGSSRNNRGTLGITMGQYC